MQTLDFHDFFGHHNDRLSLPSAFILKHMTIREKIGQMLLFGWQGDSPVADLFVSAHAKALIEDLAVGGVVVMGRNYSSPAQLKQTFDEMQRRNAEQGRTPLFTAVDQEGGRVARLTPAYFPKFPPVKIIGDTNDPQFARASAAAIAQELKSVGFNWDFAPVLDVNNNPDNPVIGDRSYGDNAALVCEMGVAAVRGFQEDEGMLACGKHFPGHGDTNLDSHKALPRIDHGRERLDQVELAPFRAAIKAGLAALMTSHIIFSQLDPDLPATLSKPILTGLLREEMGFEGLIITDDLEMNGVAAHWGTAESAVLAVIAGADMLVCCHTLSTQREIRDALLQAVETGRITECRIDESLARIISAKECWIKPEVSPLREDGFPEHAALVQKIQLAATSKN